MCETREPKTLDGADVNDDALIPDLDYEELRAFSDSRTTRHRRVLSQMRGVQCHRTAASHLASRG